VVFISSYKWHSIFAILLSLLFFLNPISIAMAIIGANLSDFDLDIKKINIYRMEIIGIILCIVLYISKLPYFIGIILCILPVIFYFSNHRGFTHSLIGIIILSILIFLVALMSLAILSLFLNSLGLINMWDSLFIHLLPVVIIIIFLAIFTLNKKLIIPFIVLFLLGVLFSPEGFFNYIIPLYNGLFEYIYQIFSPILLYFNSIIPSIPTINTIDAVNTIPAFSIITIIPSISTIPTSSINSINYSIYYTYYNYYLLMIFIFLPLLLGFLSHLILDSLTPSGIELFRPFSSLKVHKKFAIFCFIFLTFLAILQYSSLFSLM